MKLGLSTYAYAWAIGIAGYTPTKPMDINAFIKRASELKIKVVQIADNLPLHSLTKSELNCLVAKTEVYGIQIEVGTRGIQPDHLHTYLRLAQRFRSPILRVVVDTTDHHPSQEEVITILRPMIPDFAAAGVTLAIENHDRFKVQMLVEIIQALDSPFVGICLDTVNSFGAGEGPDVIINALSPYVVNLHIKDYVIKRHHHMLGFEVLGTPAGQGQLNIPPLIEALSSNNRNFNAILELWPPLDVDIETTILKENIWVETSIHYLRTFITE